VIPGSEVRELRSAQTGRTYRITISLPYAYTRPRQKGWPFDGAPRTWPVVIALDADYHIGMVTDLVRSMAWGMETSDAIVVGIGYGGGADMPDAWREAGYRRGADFTAVRCPRYERGNARLFHRRRPAQTGDAARFLRFLQRELLPLLERDFRVDQARRVLLGHSLGGLFAAYAVLAAPALFEAAALVSPALNFGEHFIFAREAAFARRRGKLATRVHVSVSDREQDEHDATLGDALRFAARLQRYPGARVARQVFSDLNHAEVLAPGFQAGLKFALARRA
jgi:predicted alpha/beta superfamily hydrolase